MAYIFECTDCNKDHDIQHMQWDVLVCPECGFEMLNTLPEMYRNYINLQYKAGIWYYIGTKDGSRRTLEAHVRKNKNRMYLGGSYIKKDSPLHQPGNYDTYTDLAFNSLYGDKKIIEGNIYLISNPAWVGWLKLGRAFSVKDRLRHFQTSSPFRDYKVEYSIDVEDARAMETVIQNKLSQKCTKNNEWFKLKVTDAKKIIKKIIEVSEHE